jgi:hypothetical protein
MPCASMKPTSSTRAFTSAIASAGIIVIGLPSKCCQEETGGNSHRDVLEFESR